MTIKIEELGEGVFRAFDPDNPWFEGLGATREEAKRELRQAEREIVCFTSTCAQPKKPDELMRLARRAPVQRKGRGRPRQEGQPGWMGIRAMMILEAYQRLRTKGKTRRGAIGLCVKELKERHPRVPVSETEVKRILAEFDKPGRAFALLPVFKDGKLVALEGGHLHVVKEGSTWVIRAIPGPRPPAPRPKPRAFRYSKKQS